VKSIVVDAAALNALVLVAAPFTSKDTKLPTLVKLEPVTVEFKVAPVNVPAAADTVISALPSKATPLMFFEAANLVAVAETSEGQDGYIYGATVFVDANNNGILNTGEFSASTNAVGAFSLPSTGALVMRGGVAEGVAWSRNGGQERRVSMADGCVILAAGAVQSPKLLELSGIGDAGRVKALGLDLAHHSPGVGENLQDHLQLRPIYKVSGVPTLNEQYANLMRRPLMAADYALRRRGPMTMAPSQMGAFAKSNERHATPNIQFHVQPLALPKFGEAMYTFPAITISVCNLRPDSRGSVHAGSPDASAAPEIQPNYLAAESDRMTAVESLRLVRRIVDQPALKRFAPQEFAPGAALQSDTELAKAAGDVGTTIFHPVGTAKMGMASDAMAVVDERLRVRGVERLRVIDASVMPRITSGNTNSPTLMIAEKGATLLLEDARS
jgi:choline dehydrogenase-like flavoprotein